jgi:hypothetical protein
MIVIDKNVPLPEKHAGRKPKYPFAKMMKGDSFLFDVGATQHSIGATVSRAAYRLGMEFTTRKVGNRIRVWRIA